MRSIIVLCAAIALAAGEGYAVNIDQMEVAYLCTRGSTMGEKLLEAFHLCSGEMTQQTYGARSLLRSDFCPSPSEIKKEVKGYLQGEICVFKQLGWMDNFWKTGLNEETILADLSSLPEEVSYFLLDESIMGDCVDDTTEYIYSTTEQCFATYTEAQQSKVARTIDFYAKVTCFTRTFEEVCQEYVKGLLYAASYNA